MQKDCKSQQSVQPHFLLGGGAGAGGFLIGPQLLKITEFSHLKKKKIALRMKNFNVFGVH